jgi:hypothetical protein
MPANSRHVAVLRTQNTASTRQVLFDLMNAFLSQPCLHIVILFSTLEGPSGWGSNAAPIGPGLFDCSWSDRRTVVGQIAEAEAVRLSL